jgi:hypothetical protein
MSKLYVLRPLADNAYGMTENPPEMQSSFARSVALVKICLRRIPC